MRRLTGLGLALILMLGCVPAQAILQCDQNIAINRAHELDADLPQQARDIAQDNGDAWEAQRYLLTGDPISDEARERSERRNP